MKQEIFDTRQRAIELLEKSISIWRNSDHADKLEGVERDPVFSLLITALAYQANETDSDIERLKQDVLDEYARLLTPYEVGHATKPCLRDRVDGEVDLSLRGGGLSVHALVAVARHQCNGKLNSAYGWTPMETDSKVP